VTGSTAGTLRGGGPGDISTTGVTGDSGTPGDISATGVTGNTAGTLGDRRRGDLDRHGWIGQ
jgi:hypothetical protein